ncbi:hypothetical protein [Streptomyces amritsarensis]|uniref:hypothetical protein n=1 Tax=Streptomyces amritsarensis TaxID=681158 RepID=UPI00117E603A|nr:hypothetical protein [Streptomyces amritsarensis]
MYRPDDDGEEQHFDMRSVRTSEAQIVERTTDMKWGEIKLGVRDDEPTALRGIVWVLMKRGQPSLRWSEFDPPVDSLTSRFDAREVASYAAEIVKLPEGQRAQAVAELKAYALDEALVEGALKDAAEPPKETVETSAASG